MTILLTQWAQRHGVSQLAYNELMSIVNIEPTTPDNKDIVSESGASRLCRLQASKAGGRLMRNNVGAVTTDDNRFIRYGLANESKQMNKLLKSSDYIGIQPVIIQPHHVGHTIGQFTAREMKKPGWIFAGTERENAQLNFILLINRLGGNASFSTGGY